MKELLPVLSVCCLTVRLAVLRVKKLTYRPTSNAGEATGLSSVVIVKIPSNLRSSKGLVTSAEI